MKKFTDAAPYFYAIAIAGFGVIQLVVQNFLTGFFPVPTGLPWRVFWVDLCSVLFLLSGAGLALRVRPYLAAMIAGYIFFLFFFSVHLPKMLTDIYNPNAWSPAFEALMLGSGAFIIADNLGSTNRQRNRITGAAAVAGIYLFALSLVVFAVLHIRYNPYIITLIPGWMPAHLFLSYLVIAGFLLASFSFFTNLKVPLASASLGIMFLFWVLTLHVPRAIGKWTVESEWASLFVALAVCGIAFSIYRRATRAEFTVNAVGIDWESWGAKGKTGVVSTRTGFGALGKGVSDRTSE
jgi:hypothetical protein